jgi:hypothetical protein
MMAVMMVMGETAMATATAMAMMPPLLPTATMSMTMMAAIRGRQLDNGNLTTMMG